jgi:hypothetical protein
VVGGHAAQPEDLLVEPAERRALVARDERGGPEPAPAVGAHLVEQDAHERLDAAQEDGSLLEQVLVVEPDVGPAELDRGAAAVAGRRRGVTAGDRVLLGARHSGPSPSRRVVN